MLAGSFSWKKAMRPGDVGLRKAALQKRMLMAGVIGMPGCVLLALGMNALWGNAMLPWLASRDAALSVIGVAAVILIWELLIIVPTVIELGHLNQEKQPPGSA